MRAGIVVMMSRWSIAFVVGVSFHFFPSEGLAGIGDWKNHTDMKNVRSIATDGKTVWAATSGGVFRFNPVDSTYQKFVNSNGLSTNDVTAIFIDLSSRVWIGHQSGNIDLYDPRSEHWSYVTDIALTSQVNRTINGFYQNGDDLYIATAFGVTVFSISKFEFSDTYTGFDQNILQPNVTATAVFQDRLFLTTSAGIISSNAGAGNLSDPKSWTVSSPLITSANHLLEFNGGLYASTASGMLKFQNNSWNITNGLVSNVRIVAALDTAILFVDGTELKALNTVNSVSVFSAAVPGTVTSGTVTANKTIFLGFSSSGIGSMNAAFQWRSYFPNGPNSNKFYHIVVDERGHLWSASGANGGGTGFSRFDGSLWRNFTTSNTPLLRTNDCFAVSIGPNNSKWISTWGEGLLLIDANETVVRRFDYDNPGFFGVIRDPVDGIPSYTVPGRVAVDKSGAIWVTIYASINKNKVVWKMNADSSWQSFPGSPFGSPSSFMRHIVIDQNDTKWFMGSIIGSNPPENITSVFFNEKNSVSNTTNGWGFISENDGLTDDHIYSIVVEQSGDLWLGTGNGITIITNPSNPTDRVSKVFQQSVRDQAVNCIAIDALNNKWVGTSTGVYVLSFDGTQLLAQYTVESTNRQLVDNNIQSIAFDMKRGIAYFGTEKGLSSLEVAAIASKNKFTSIDLSPNPIYLPSQSSVEIRGLVDESTIKVMALNGKVIKQFSAQGGGRAFWDCRDSDGRLVASGIYIIVAHNRIGDQVSSAKVAVIQQ